MKLTLGQTEELDTVYQNIAVKGLANLTVAENRYKLFAQVKILNETKDKLLKQYSGGESSLDSSSPNFKSFWADYTKVLKTEVEIEDLAPINKSDIDIKPQDTSLQNFLFVLMVHELLGDKDKEKDKNRDKEEKAIAA